MKRWNWNGELYKNRERPQMARYATIPSFFDNAWSFLRSIDLRHRNEALRHAQSSKTYR
jgi:hypothetical protein